MEKELGSRGEKQIPRGTEHIVKHRVPVMEGAVHWSSPFIVSGQFADHLNQSHLHGGLAGEPEGGQKGDGEAFQGSALTRWWSFINLFTITPQCHSSLLSFSPKLRLISDFTCQNSAHHLSFRSILFPSLSFFDWVLYSLPILGWKGSKI